MNSIVISQEEPSDFQGYMGYVGSTVENDKKSSTYAQEEPNTFNTIYGQQIFGTGPTYSHGFTYSPFQVNFL